MCDLLYLYSNFTDLSDIMQHKIKGIILAGGSGTRLYPLTVIASKQLQVIYDKPMIYYPIASLMLSGIRDILLITTPQDVDNFRKLLRDGSQWGINISYEVQQAPRGIAEAFIIGEKFIGSDPVCLILGDNLFYGKLNFLRNALENTDSCATIFGYAVKDPTAYGVVEFSKNGDVLSIEEKPKVPKSNYAIPGVYVFDNRVVEIAKKLTPSARGELEITDIQKVYLEMGQLKVEIIGRGVAWLDTGTADSLLDASMFIQAIEKRQGLKIACPEEIALNAGYLTREQYLTTINELPKSPYREYCEKILAEHDEK